VLTPDRIKPFLLHEDPYVRAAATDYFTESWSRDPDILPMVLDAVERYGVRDLAGDYRDLDHLVLSESSFGRVLEHLDEAGGSDLGRRLEDVISRAPGALLAARETVMAQQSERLTKIAPRIERRRQLTAWSGERLWDELQDFARRSADQHTTNEVDLDYADDLVDALASFDVPDAETIGRMLRELEPEEGWLEIFLVDLAGARRVAQAIPQLVGKYRIDTDYLLDRVSIALARIGDPEASRQIAETYPVEGPGFRIYAASMLGEIKHPESEEAILSLLGIETDETFRTILCGGLCKLFSERAFSVVKQEIDSDYDRTWARLEDLLLPVAEVLGVELPEAPEWRRARAKQEQAIAARIKEMNKGLHVSRLEAPRLPERRRPRPAPQEPVEIESPAEPIRRTEPRVGRNEPCPCGSGKKFKKCCGLRV
jgi:hypothetical protein